jgi:2'-5' RNA ligase
MKLNEIADKTYSHGCIMVGLNLPGWNNFTNKFIADEDIAGDGRETECHTTILYGFLPEVTIEDVKTLLLPLNQIYVTLTQINCFTGNSNYDVVKFEAASPLLNQMNTILKTLPNKTTFPSYNPHVTIGYVKPGLGDKYIRNIKPITLQPVNYIFSQSDGTKLFFTL